MLHGKRVARFSPTALPLEASAYLSFGFGFVLMVSTTVFVGRRFASSTGINSPVFGVSTNLPRGCHKWPPFEEGGNSHRSEMPHAPRAASRFKAHDAGSYFHSVMFPHFVRRVESGTTYARRASLKIARPRTAASLGHYTR